MDTGLMDNLTVHVLGDYCQFSRMWKSIGYKLQIGRSAFLLDCGAPLFQQLGGHGLKEIEGLIITHCHDDHKRWLGDLALFCRYAPDVRKKVRLFTSERVYDDLREATAPALTRGLSDDSKTVVDLAFEDFIEHHLLGPRARYRIVSNCYGSTPAITDRQGIVLPPDRAKIIINPITKITRMIFKDPEYGEWVEPESFYSFSSPLFYEENKNIYSCNDGATIEAINAPVWHGVASIGVKIKKDGETLVFSSDTVHDRVLWKQLCSEKRPQRLHMSRTEFEAATVVYGDINDYIERIWSEERYEDAVNAFKDAAVIHDISIRNSVVHTDYEKLNNTTLDKARTLLVHGPDRFTSEWALCDSGKTYKVKGGRFLEIAAGRCFPMNADIYHKERGKYYVGYRSEEGGRTVYEKEGLLNFATYDGTDVGRPLYRVDLYEDVSGGYFPALDDPGALYFERGDGKVELMRFNDQGSCGEIVEDQRERLAGRELKGT